MEPAEATILLVEDHRATRTFLADNLCADGYEILEADSVRAAKTLLKTKFPDLAIIDLSLPDGDGLDLIATVRAAGSVPAHTDPELPMLVLSGRATEVDLLRGFRRGCDDYLGKPFSYVELLARVQALLRRTRRRPGARRIQVGPLAIDPLARQAWLHGDAVALSNKEFGLLRALAAEPARAFTREELLQVVWGFRTPGATRTLDSHAARLRRKLSAGGARFVVNVWGVGYRLIDGELPE